MGLKPKCSLEEVSLEEIFTELKVGTLAFKKTKRRYLLRNFYLHLFPEPYCIKVREKKLNKHLVKNLLPIAKTLTYFKLIHCEPREMHFCNLRKGTLGARSMRLLCINRCDYDSLMVPSVLSHETAHALGGLFFEESLPTLLGWEIDARMALAGHTSHRTSLYKCIRDTLIHVSYLKAKSIDKIDEWKDFIGRLYKNEIVINEGAEHFEKAEKGLFHALSDYTLLPYLSIKDAVRANSAYVLEECDYFDPPKIEKIEIPALLKIWKEIMT